MGLTEVKNEIEVSNDADEIIMHMKKYESVDVVFFCDKLFRLGNVEALNSLFKKSDINCFEKRSSDSLFRKGYKNGYLTAVLEHVFHEGPIYEFHYNDTIDDFQYRNGWFLGFGNYIFKIANVKDEVELRKTYDFYFAAIVNEMLTSTECELQTPEIRKMKEQERIKISQQKTGGIIKVLS